ncbi:MAG: hypothetical protein CYPHOPRED_005830 [Cyphobasidiales sp. Tagirdzhanova-0007]|nr:MAG: hypothetical protein CYPHOPRED_005830 [Cyphobasidiales sp. Tagirdzhanova-0007]
MSGTVSSAPATGGQTLNADGPYTEKAPLAGAFSVGLQGAGVGLLVSSVQNSLQTHNKGALGVFTRTGGTIGIFAAVPATFTYIDQALANLRSKDDAVNGAAGGCAAGFLMGVQRGSLPSAFGGCAFLAVLIGTVDAAGRSLTGDGRQNLPLESREEQRRQFFKKRPLADQVLRSDTAAD